MSPKQVFPRLDAADFAAALARLYGADDVRRQTGRWADLAASAAGFLQGPVRAFSAPGRTELGGNHTDHNRGRVLAAAIRQDSIALAAPRPEGRVRIRSRGYPEIAVDLADLAPRPAEAGTPAALVRGVAEYLSRAGVAVGGFDAASESEVLPGSGLSSSASFEVLVGAMLSAAAGGAPADPVLLAKAGQYAENRHFGKPCGLMDQAAAAVGGAVGIDFADPERPVVRRAVFDIDAAGYALAVVDSGGSHANLTPDYAAIPAEMKLVAAALGAAELRGVGEAAFRAELPRLRGAVGDRAVLRALHFFAEDRRAGEQFAALERGDLEAFLALVRESGRSSLSRLQNINPSVGGGREQGVGLALALSEDFLAGGGACRVHGGGFAGTIQAWVPEQRFESYKATMEAVFGPGRVCRLSIRPDGVIEL